MSQWTLDMSFSPLWEEDIRQEVMETKQSEQQINSLRSKLLVPGQFSETRVMKIHSSFSFDHTEPVRPIHTERLRLRKRGRKQLGSVTFYRIIHI